MMGRRFTMAVGALALAPCCGGEVGLSTDGNTSWLRCPKQGCSEGYECVRDRCVVAKTMPVTTRDAGSDPSVAPPNPMPSVPTVSPRLGTDSGLAGCTRLSDPLMGTGPAVSFRNDILPIFGLSCVTSDCHNPRDAKAGLNLGYKCLYDANAKWKCTFPADANPDPTVAQRDDEATVAAVYESLLGLSVTITSPRFFRVKPVDPENSFLVLKLADQQNSRGYTCANADPSHETNPPPCGVSMPQGGDPLCSGANRARFDAIVAWIAQGAPNN